MRSYYELEHGKIYLDCMWCRLVRALLAYAEHTCYVGVRRLPSRGWAHDYYRGMPEMSVKELTEQEVYEVQQSDMKLWDMSTTEIKGTTIIKALVLPFGIGEVRVQFEGVDNGIKRRSAAEQWGNMVRQTIKDRIDDESVTARAKQAAALRPSEDELEGVGSANSGDGTQDEAAKRLRDNEAVQTATPPAAVQAHAFANEGDQGPAGTDFAARAEWLRERIGDGERQLKGWKRELKALEAALAVMGEDE